MRPAFHATTCAQLFARTKRSVRLTEAGKLFLTDARRILALSEQAGATARRAERGEAGELRVGFTFSTPLTPLFAAVINRYRRAYPHVTLTLHEMATLRQLDGLTQRTIDLGFIRPPDRGHGDELKLTPMREDPLVAVLPTTLALARSPAGQALIWRFAAVEKGMTLNRYWSSNWTFQVAHDALEDMRASEPPHEKLGGVATHDDR